MSSQLPTQVKLGDFVFDTVQRQLILAGTVTVLEPKVYDLLCYLLLHSERFVSLAELHQQVWAGRVVTDTAVRRTISKLRVALGDTDSENPRYLKTQMKLGYQLVCENSALPNAELPVMPKQVAVTAKPSVKKRFVVVLMILLAVLIAAYLLLFRNLPAILVTPVLSVPGEKLALNVSPDGRYLSYVAQSSHDKQWQPFLYDSNNGTVSPLEPDIDYSEKFIIPSFDIDGSLIATHNAMQRQDVRLVFYDKTNFNIETESISSDKFEKLLYVQPFDTGRYLINGQKHNSESVHYYVFERNSKQFSQLTFSNLNTVGDVDARVSPDGAYVAVLRQQVSSELKLALQLYRLSDSTFITEWTLPGKQSDAALIGFSWLSNQQLLLSKHSNLYQIDIKNKEVELLEARGQFGYMQRDAQGQLYAIQYGDKRTETMKTRWGAAKDILQRYDFTLPILQQDFAETDYWHWHLVQQDSVYSLHRFEPQSGAREVVIADTEGYRLEAQNAKSGLLILRSGFHLRLFDRNSKTWRDLSQPTQHVSYATFSPDNRYIWFNERVGSEWFINQFDLSSNRQQRLAEGYFKLYQWQQYYIGITAQGDIWLLDQQWSRIQQVPIQFITQYRHHIAIRGDNLFVAHLLQNSHWQFERYNLVSGEMQKKLDESLPIQTIVSIDSTGTNMLVSSRFAASHDLVKITLQ